MEVQDAAAKCLKELGAVADKSLKEIGEAAEKKLKNRVVIIRL